MLEKHYFIGGDATFTLDIPHAFQASNPDVKAHYTYRIRHKEANGNFDEAYFVSLMSGPDNHSDFSYLGKLNPETGAVALTRGSKFTEEAWPVRLLRRSLAVVWSGDQAKIEQAGFRLMHDGHCSVCGRKLTTPESLDSGIGPVCATKFG